MFIDETATRVQQPSVTASASLASDLSWFLSVAARPRCRPSTPSWPRCSTAARTWPSASAPSGTTAPRRRASPRCRCSRTTAAGPARPIPTRSGGPLRRGGHRPGRAGHAARESRRARRRRLPVPRLRESPAQCSTCRRRAPRSARSTPRPAPLAQGVPRAGRAYLDLLKEVWAPVNDMWQQALPLIEEAGRHVVAQYDQNGQSLEPLVLPGCDTLRERHALDPERPGSGQVAAVRPVPVLRLLHVPRVPRPDRDRHRRGPGRRRGPGPDRVGGTAAQGGGRPRPAWPSCTRWPPRRAPSASWPCSSAWPSPR